MGTPLLGQFLVAINGFISVNNSTSLTEYLVLEPPFNPTYNQLIAELRTHFPPTNDTNLDKKVERTVPQANPSLLKFLQTWLHYLRDVSADASEYLSTYALLLDLQSRANVALAHEAQGWLILPTVITTAQLLSRLAIGLDARPELILQLRPPAPPDDPKRETLAEKAANTIRGAVVTCLTTREAGLSPAQAKKRAIYRLANICLRILIRTEARSAFQIFEKINALAPGLRGYSKSDRVTFLYYLGRFHLQTGHYIHAARALEGAYGSAPAHEACTKQRRLIVVYLVTANLLLGRFPSREMLGREECVGLGEYFGPICEAVRRGNVSALRGHLDLKGPLAQWFLRFRILFQLRSRCEVLAWRSIVRRTWLAVGTRPPPESKITPQVGLEELGVAFRLAGAEDMDGEGDEAVESKLASLIDQGLVRGFIAHRHRKFCITGVQKHDGDALRAGFPEPWSVMVKKAEGEHRIRVPGWRTTEAPVQVLGGVVNLKGVREIGS
ncbi:hypothetical protein K470DRAFT_243865 [Piedraia hortae CBS 480.64]|uniref:26S proteasome non-ATPase regulatory subunit 3 N-terminal TPR repeats domain-containing protein n=1 Tax=Piedraia hortae CBS 480.64 TaxID=1314780 RepID=A0A6A7C5G7_9PEZI|nr:hypothetical protein K470DRAFT_243865 [Piedraia hortae CBS 480.64]